VNTSRLPSLHRTTAGGRRVGLASSDGITAANSRRGWPSVATSTSSSPSRCHARPAAGCHAAPRGVATARSKRSAAAGRPTAHVIAHASLAGRYATVMAVGGGAMGAAIGGAIGAPGAAASAGAAGVGGAAGRVTDAVHAVSASAASPAFTPPPRSPAGWRPTRRSRRARARAGPAASGPWP
jgi:hypothetical protein